MLELFTKFQRINAGGRFPLPKSLTKLEMEMDGKWARNLGCIECSKKKLSCLRSSKKQSSSRLVLRELDRNLLLEA